MITAKPGSQSNRGPYPVSRTKMRAFEESQIAMSECAHEVQQQVNQGGRLVWRCATCKGVLRPAE